MCVDMGKKIGPKNVKTAAKIIYLIITKKAEKYLL